MNLETLIFLSFINFPVLDNKIRGEPQLKVGSIPLTYNKLSLVVLYVVVISFILFISVPILAIFLRLKPDQLLTQLQSPTVIDALIISFFSSAVATFMSFVLAVPTAYFLATRKFRGKIALDTLMDLPIVLPPAVAGIALLLAFAPRGLFGPWLNSLNLVLPGSILAVIIAQVFVASPFVLRSSKNAFQNIEPDLINSARILTASKIRIFFIITLPLSKRQVISGLAMTWARAIGEFGATLMFAGNMPSITQTMPLAIYSLMAEDPFGAFVLSAIMIIFSFAILTFIKIIDQKKERANHD